MSGDDSEDLPDELQQAVAAVRRLHRDHGAISAEEARQAVRLLLDGADVDVDPEQLLGTAEAEGETESPTA